MEYVNLGSTGLRVSRVCLGMMSFGAHPERPWALGEADAEPIIRRAVEGGITFFDTADVYNGGESEVITGRVLPKLLSARGVRRRDQGARPDDARRERPRPVAQARAGVDRRLAAAARARLRRPLPDPPLGPTTPIEETMEALHDVVRAGKARYIGASSMFAWQFAKAQAVAERARLDEVRLDAEPLQPRLPRGGARDDPAVPRPGRRPSCRGARSPAACSPGTARATGERLTTRARHRLVRRLALHARGRLRRRRPGGRGRRRARRAARAGGARLAAAAGRA